LILLFFIVNMGNRNSNSVGIIWYGPRDGLGQRHGNGEEYNSFTGVTRRGRYWNDRADGLWLSFNKNGEHILTESYDDGNLLEAYTPNEKSTSIFNPKSKSPQDT
jgi:hypothetical protein